MGCAAEGWRWKGRKGGREGECPYACVRSQPLIEWRPNPPSLASHTPADDFEGEMEGGRKGAGKGDVRINA